MKSETLEPTENAPWRRFRLHRWVLFGGWIGMIPYGLLVAALTHKAPNSPIGTVLIALYFVGWSVNNVLLSRFACPRCGARFTQRRRERGVFSNPFTRRCLNCGQRAYRSIEPGPIETAPFRFFEDAPQ